MKTICLYFQIHQPFRLRTYRFFDISNNSYYYDDYTNESILNKVANNCYLPANKTILNAIKNSDGKFKVAFSISGIALKQFELYTPQVIESFKELADTGNVEFLTETYSHSLVALKDKNEFKKQVKKHHNLIKKLFGVTPVTFRNTELIYSDEIGDTVCKMGYKTMLTEGAKHILGWKSPNFLYCNSINPKLKLLLKNYKLSDDIAFRFSDKNWAEYPLTANKFIDWIDTNDNSEVINLFMDYETFGEHQWANTGIFGFVEDFVKKVINNDNLSFDIPKEVSKKLQPVSPISVPYPISWADEERDLTAWLGNDMQEDAFNKLYDLLPKINKCDDEKILTDWDYLQTSDHFYYMCTKHFSDGDVHAYFNPYESPYQAFINYMNVLSDFTIRVNAAVPENTVEENIAMMQEIISEKDQKIKDLENNIKKLRKKYNVAKLKS